MTASSTKRVVGLPGFRDLHPLQEVDGCQGALELMWRLQEMLAEVAGLDAVTLQPAAGSQGELLGLMRRGPERIGERVLAYDAVRGASLEVQIVSPVFLDPEGARLRG